MGCGWGSLVLFMAAEYDCQVTGVTPSATQAAYIVERAGELGHYRRTTIAWETRALANRDDIEKAAPGMFDPLLSAMRNLVEQSALRGARCQWSIDELDWAA
jgi:cyclopropane fatty-acyl-phospholipid synthase-like methyltransferase